MDQAINPPVTLEITDTDAGLMGWLVVDSIIDNHFCGGLRMLPDVSAAELAELAKAMTLKHAFLGIPHGGAKAGIRFNGYINNKEKLRLLAAFGLKIRNLLADRVYLPGPDMGTNNQDIRYMLKTAGIRIPKKALKGGNSGWYTGLTVIESAKTASVYQGIDLANATVAIEGFGKVGSSVAHGLNQLGSKIVAISTSEGALYSPDGLDIEKLVKISDQHGSKAVDFYDGAEKINREALLELDVDVLMPCARHRSIDMDNVSKIKARLISSGSNAPVTAEAENLLSRRGILCIPDSISNSGGVLGGTMEFAGLNQSAIMEFINSSFSGQVSSLIEKARKKDVYIRKLAEDIAGERFTRMKNVSEDISVRNKVFSLALQLYRIGIVPKACVGALAGRYFKKRIEGRM